ncbi:MAG: carboxylating nicotinate-nucleotide diphosphorylase [Deltaproteobacteria bacterium]|nr:carboxylating nicotinate-nucleotide diphosphorylase [Deltaproteobacteria bacterium]
MELSVGLLSSPLVESIIDLALLEDAPFGDVTVGISGLDDAVIQADIIAQEKCVIAGLPVLVAVFKKTDPGVLVDTHVSDGEAVDPGMVVASVHGNAGPILTAERTALNFLQRLSGIATLTRKFKEELKGTDTILLPTRKTTPGHRVIERYAVFVGGGRMHRASLSDGILIKDNHIAAAGGLVQSVRLARLTGPWTLKVEVEVTTLEEVRDAVDAGADIIMFDNMSPEQVQEACRLCPPNVLTEASGGITLDTARKYAEAGVNAVSVGILTHSSRAIDFSMEIERT